MHGQWKIFAIAWSKRLALLTMIMLAVGCAPTEFLRPVIDWGGGGRTTGAAKSSRTAASPEIGATVVVNKGDSLYKISRRHNVDLRDLIRLNGIRSPYYIFKGQRIRLPRRHLHLVKTGETLYGVSRRYNIDMATLVRVNKIAPPYRIAVGSRLRLPSGPSRLSRKAGMATRDTRSKSRLANRRRHGRASSPVALNRLPPRSRSRFLWPVHGRIIVGFGPRAGGLHNDGINILAREGTAVRAAENGVVAYSGNELRGFGNLLLVKHTGGWMSAYAHNAKLLVSVGQKVERGQTIARVGATGSVVRPQLHFELRRGVRVVNPIKHLQPLRAEFGTVRPTAFLGVRPDLE